MIHLLALAVLGMACAPDDGDDFRTCFGDECDYGSDTGSSSESSSTPQLENPTAYWDDYPNIGRVVEVSADYTDAEDDLVGGTLSTEVFDDGESLGSLEAEIEQDEGSAWVPEDETTVYFVIQNLNEGTAYEIDFEVTDLAGNTSDTVTATVE